MGKLRLFNFLALDHFPVEGDIPSATPSNYFHDGSVPCSGK